MAGPVPDPPWSSCSQKRISKLHAAQDELPIVTKLLLNSFVFCTLAWQAKKTAGQR